MVRVQYVGTLFEFAYETYLTYSYGTVSRPGATGGIPGPFPPSNHCLCPSPPQTRIVPPKRGLCPKESNRLGVTGVQFNAWGSKNTGNHPGIREQELFFAEILQ